MPLTRPTILIVDDEPGVLAALHRLLRQDGYRILKADGASAALEMLASQPVDVIVSDYQMPGQSGTELLAQVQQDYPDTVRLILSGQADMNEVVRSMDSGGIYKFLSKPWDGAMLRADIREACRRAREIAEVEDRLNVAAQRDQLTGLPNRAGLKRCFESMATDGNDPSMLLIGLDCFQNINTRFGSHFGSVALRRLTSGLREIDRIAHLGRVGDAELLALAPDLGGGSAGLASTILSRIQEPLQVEGRDVLLSANIGVCDGPLVGASFGESLSRARSALLEAKKRGRNQHAVFDEQMMMSTQRHSQVVDCLSKAIAAGELSLVYQPQFEIATGRFVGVESLLRWKNPELGHVSPAEFVPIAEEAGLILPIGEWVLDAACRQAHQWREAGGAAFKLAINVSPAQLLNDDFTALVRSVLRRSSVHPSEVELEITETALLNDIGRARAMLLELDEMGVALALDDFGTGYSCMSYLKHFPFQKLKLDRAFVQGIDSESDLAPLTRGIITMARDLGMTVTAEGVETEEELDFLHACSCDIVQGYLWGKPVPAEEVLPMLCANEATMRELKHAG